MVKYRCFRFRENTALDKFMQMEYDMRNISPILNERRSIP